MYWNGVMASVNTFTGGDTSLGLWLSLSRL